MKIIITENQYKKLSEDLKYWGVSDATDDEYEMGVELDEDGKNSDKVKLKSFVDSIPKPIKKN
jgi:hypothetical protein|tara:strand:- start:1490 stop:1678 length:189 start_codon:yes stop_codon:yes gene_type:complete